jgi:hypothetical protein
VPTCAGVNWIVTVTEDRGGIKYEFELVVESGVAKVPSWTASDVVRSRLLMTRVLLPGAIPTPSAGKRTADVTLKVPLGGSGVAVGAGVGVADSIGVPVGVAVGSEVLVAVAVAMAVGVALSVALGIGVEVADAVPVAVPVGVDV